MFCFLLVFVATGTKDFIRHTSQVAKPSCPQRFVPSFHLFLLESGPHLFRLLDGQPKSTNQCSADCCESRDCLLSFIEGSKCYGVVGREAQESGTNSNYRKGLGLQVAVIDRNKGWFTRSLEFLPFLVRQTSICVRKQETDQNN